VSTLYAIRERLQEIAASASIAAQALDAGRLDFLPPELSRLLGALDGVRDRLADVCDRLAEGVDPQGASGSCHSSPSAPPH
jgi:hypothetical protein